jgi:acid phosphatase
MNAESATIAADADKYWREFHGRSNEFGRRSSLFSLIISLALSFNYSWCEPLLIDYSPLPGCDLLMVQVVTRHGARTPLHVSRRLPHMWHCNLTEFHLFSGSGAGAVRVHVSFGDSVFLGDCHFGQLTGRGADALRRLGAHFRAIYVDRLKFLPTHFRASAVRFRSTFTHRTLHSAMALIKGLFPRGVAAEIFVADKTLDHWRKSIEWSKSVPDSHK